MREGENGLDQYLDDNRVVSRLAKEWSKYGKIVIAYDFDNTVYDFHDEGCTYDDVISLLRKSKQMGAHLIVFTASHEDRYQYITEFLIANSIPFDAINEQPNFVPVTEGRKIYYNILLDDRAGLSSAYNSLKRAIELIEKGEC